MLSFAQTSDKVLKWRWIQNKIIFLKPLMPQVKVLWNRINASQFYTETNLKWKLTFNIMILHYRTNAQKFSYRSNHLYNMLTFMAILFIWFHSFFCFGFSCLSGLYPVSLTEYHVLDSFSSCPWTHSCLQLDLHLVHLKRHQSTLEHQFYFIKTHYCKVQGTKLYNCNHK